VTQQMLSKQLKELEAYNLVDRKVYPEVPPRVEHSLAERDLSVLPVIHNWATEEFVSSEIPVDWNRRNYKRAPKYRMLIFVCLSEVKKRFRLNFRRIFDGLLVASVYLFVCLS